VGRPELQRVLPTARGSCLSWGSTTRIMAIVNLTPDSFSDGGTWGGDIRQQLEGVRQLVHQGAHIIDIGGQSTRPGAPQLSADEELQRVLPLIQCVAPPAAAACS
jgi:dihydropteroate synthase